MYYRNCGAPSGLQTKIKTHCIETDVGHEACKPKSKHTVSKEMWAMRLAKTNPNRQCRNKCGPRPANQNPHTQYRRRFGPRGRQTKIQTHSIERDVGHKACKPKSKHTVWKEMLPIRLANQNPNTQYRRKSNYILGGGSARHTYLHLAPTEGWTKDAPLPNTLRILPLPGSYWVGASVQTSMLSTGPNELCCCPDTCCPETPNEI